MSQITHYPHRNGPVCGLSPPPTHATAYTVDDPSCPKCAEWIAKVRASAPVATGNPPQTQQPTKRPKSDKADE